MNPLILRIIFVILGIILFAGAFISYSHKRLNERIMLSWSIFSLILILLGTVPVLSEWYRSFNRMEAIVLFIILLAIVVILFKLSEYVSILSRKNQELAMHVSLLNQENERILSELQQITGKSKTEL